MQVIQTFKLTLVVYRQGRIETNTNSFIHSDQSHKTPLQILKLGLVFSSFPLIIIEIRKVQL